MPRLVGRRQALRLLAAPLGLGIAACGSGRSRRVGNHRQISVWTLDLAPRFTPYMNRVISAWERDHPGVRVRWTDVPWSSVERKLLAAVFARTAPDLVNLNPPFAANLASKGGLLDLSTKLPSGASEAYLPRIWRSGRQGANQFAIPWYLTARVTMANRQLLGRAGIDAPPLRWQEVPAYAEAIHRRTGRYALFVTAVPDDSAELLESMVQMGTQLLDNRQRAAFNSPAGRHAFAFWTDLYRRGLLPREVVSQGYRRAIELFQAGDLAQVATGPDFLRNLQTNAPGIAAATAPYPPLSGADGEANVAVMNLVVPKQSERAKDAISFALFLTNAANQLAFAEEARVLPSSKAALAAPGNPAGRPAATPGRRSAGAGGPGPVGPHPHRGTRPRACHPGGQTTAVDHLHPASAGDAGADWQRSSPVPGGAGMEPLCRSPLALEPARKFFHELAASAQGRGGIRPRKFPKK